MNLADERRNGTQSSARPDAVRLYGQLHRGQNRD